MALVSGANKEQNIARVAKSRKVIVDNLSLNLGQTSKDLHNWFTEKLTALKIKDVQIIDIDVQGGGADNSVQIELGDYDMID